MKQTSSHGETGIQMQDGDDFVCPNCGCEIRLVHHGDPAKMPNMQMFTCCCGTRMEKEQRGAEPGPPRYRRRVADSGPLLDGSDRDVWNVTRPLERGVTTGT